MGCITRLKFDLNFKGVNPKQVFNKSKVLKAFKVGYSTQKLWSEQYYCNVQHLEVLETWCIRPEAALGTSKSLWL